MATNRQNKKVLDGNNYFYAPLIYRLAKLGLI